MIKHKTELNLMVYAFIRINYLDEPLRLVWSNALIYCQAKQHSGSIPYKSLLSYSFCGNVETTFLKKKTTNVLHSIQGRFQSVLSPLENRSIDSTAP